MKPLAVRPTLALLHRQYPRAECSLVYKNPWELLVATILSAQCTDKRVNMVTPVFFEMLPTVEKAAKTRIVTIQKLIKSTGFYKNKAKAIKSSAKRIVSVYGGEVPETMEELLTLPGVARKTANVVLGAAYGKAYGIVVDTHVGRITYRFGWTQQKDPQKIEKDLMALLPKKEWISFSHRLIQHGRALCKAPIPVCSQCPLNKKCPKVGVVKEK